MPEGDTIARTALTLDRWLAGREITGARSTVLGAHARRLVGRTVLRAEARAKHLLVCVDGGGVDGEPLTLHTHQRITGLWHVYGPGDAWRMPAVDARVVLEAGPRSAVCFNSPVVELFPTRETAVHPVLRALGPDVLAGPVAAGEVLSRALALLAPATSVGELLLDQRVVSGIGNIYRSESLFVCGVYPWTAWPAAGSDRIDHLVGAAARLMGARMPGTTPAAASRASPRASPPPAVYRRSGRPCRRCEAVIRSAPIGTPPRMVWWCPACQPPP